MKTASMRKSNEAASTCPFLVEPLNRDGTSTPKDYPLRPLFPASYRTASDDLAASTRDIAACVQREFDLYRLQIIFSWLWIVGRPMPPRPLHHQLFLSRDIFITERMDMHLVWTAGRIFIKPIPRFLLVPRFWSDHLSCLPGCACACVLANSAGYTPVGDGICDRRTLWKSALGFLFSYAALVSHESDFVIARDKQLIPTEVTWSDWTILVEQVLATDHIYHNIHARFIYGELRLSRLNKIYCLTQPPFLRGYISQWHRYSDFFQDNLAWLAAATVYIVVVLTAMQVGLATNSLAGNHVFQSASYGFVIFSILGPLVALGLIVLEFCCIFFNNWITSVAYEKTRFQTIQAAQGA
ncbi:hypothetical protein N7474_010118 [Penicillium riverlandense]|uniref:uncharacterized protein n=1 Tax=Penicillium riverlandense TaxID=1903569 RepID=UPI0025467BE2|nr:uncharacterized protein N7474_010118 [Penicillium riverlandense]KAJ5808849.1 hypothetical protein N7474_010118 [Penicillium riverlandense]